MTERAPQSGKTIYRVFYSIGKHRYEATINGEHFETLSAAKQRIDELLKWPKFRVDIIDSMIIEKCESTTVLEVPAIRRNLDPTLRPEWENET